MSNRKYYLVRAVGGGLSEQQVTADAFACVGWSQLDFRGISSVEELRQEVIRIFYSKPDIDPSSLGRAVAQAERFYSIKADDVILVPIPGAVWLSRSTGERAFHEAYHDYDRTNCIGVQYIKRFPRDELSTGLQQRLRMPGSTCVALDEFREEIEELFVHGTRKASIENRAKGYRNEVEKQLLVNLRALKGIHLNAGGVGLEQLVKAIFEVRGYNAKIESKQRYPAGIDADVVATRWNHRIEQTCVYVQVKHHDGISGKEAMEQLELLRQHHIKTSEEHSAEYLAVTTADWQPETFDAQKMPDWLDIWDGPRLAAELVNVLPDLPGKVLNELGFSNLPHMLELSIPDTNSLQDHTAIKLIA